MMICDICHVPRTKEIDIVSYTIRLYKSAQVGMNQPILENSLDLCQSCVTDVCAAVNTALGSLVKKNGPNL
jgi:hypothetical protein